MDFKKYGDYGVLNITQGGWNQVDGYVVHMQPSAGIYYTARICQIDYVPTGHPDKIIVSGIANKAIEVSVLTLRNDNYIIAELGWKANGSEFTLGTYDKLAIGFRYQDNTNITPNDVNDKKVYNWTNTPHYIHNTSTDTITTLPAVLYPNDTTATVGLKGNMEQNGTPAPDNPIQPQECGDLETDGAKAGQYKIPISSANTTTPVYLGEVETTRRIKKLVLTGEENWVSKGNPATFRYENSPILHTLNSVCYCSHFKNLPWNQISTTNNSFIVWFTSAPNTINIRCDDYSTVEDFKAFLAAQYANGTPVTVWYVLATPTTGIVNEPLRKIGDYADTVSGISIPTIAGTNTLSVDTTLQPSEVTVNYHGWHPVSAVHERENGAWT